MNGGMEMNELCLRRGIKTHRGREEELCVDSCRFQTGGGILMRRVDKSRKMTVIPFLGIEHLPFIKKIYLW